MPEGRRGFLPDCAGSRGVQVEVPEVLPGQDSRWGRGAVDVGGSGLSPLRSPVSALLAERRPRVRPTDWEQREPGGERFPQPGHHRSGLSSARLGRRPPRGAQPVASPRLLPGLGHVSPGQRGHSRFNPPCAAARLARRNRTPCARCCRVPSAPAGVVAVSLSPAEPGG